LREFVRREGDDLEICFEIGAIGLRQSVQELVP
jgi:hypothetical protein